MGFFCQAFLLVVVVGFFVCVHNAAHPLWNLSFSFFILNNQAHFLVNFSAPSFLLVQHFWSCDINVTSLHTHPSVSLLVVGFSHQCLLSMWGYPLNFFSSLGMGHCSLLPFGNHMVSAWFLLPVDLLIPAKNSKRLSIYHRVLLVCHTHVYVP